MSFDNDCCSNEKCGCHSAAFTPSFPRECPVCKRKMRIMGNARAVKYRLTCPECGYQGDILSPEEIHKLL